MNEAPAQTIEVTPAQAAQMLERGAALIDVRTDEEWDAARIPGARHIRLDELPSHAAELDRSAEIVIYCRSGNRSGMAAAALAQAGYDAHNMAGGIKAWIEDGRGVEPEGAEVA